MNESSTRKVTFTLFGRFTIVVDGRELTFPEAAFFTYLKLLLLSGDSRLTDVEVLLGDKLSKNIRDSVDKGNGAPRPGQGGYFDFTAKTGLTLRYSKAIGIDLLDPASWTSDVMEFDEAWRERRERSDDELVRALDCHGDGVKVNSWSRDKISPPTKSWIQARLQQLQERKSDIELELEARRERRKAAPSNLESADPRGGLGPLSDEGIRHETSGFRDYEPELKEDQLTGAAMGQKLCQLDPGTERDHGENSGFADNYWTEMRALNEARLLEANADTMESRVESSGEVAESSEPVRILLPIETPKRTVTTIGILVTLIVAALIFLAGFMVAQMSR